MLKSGLLVALFCALTLAIGTDLYNPLTDQFGFLEHATAEYTPSHHKHFYQNYKPGTVHTMEKMVYDEKGRFHWMNVSALYPEHLIMIDQLPEVTKVECTPTTVTFFLDDNVIDDESRLHDLERGDIVVMGHQLGCRWSDDANIRQDAMLVIKEKVDADGEHKLCYKTRHAHPLEALKMAHIHLYSEHMVRESPFEVERNETTVFAHRKKHLPSHVHQKVQCVHYTEKGLKAVNKQKVKVAEHLAQMYQNYRLMLRVARQDDADDSDDIADEDRSSGFEDLPKDAIQKRGLFKAIGKGIKKIGKAVKDVVNVVVDVVKQVATFVGKVGLAALNIIKKATSALGALATKLYESIPLVKKIVDAVKDTVMKVVNAIPIVRDVVGLISKAYNLIKGVLGSMEMFLQLLTGELNYDKTIELLSKNPLSCLSGGKCEPLVDFWVSTAAMQELTMSKLGFGVSIPLRFQFIVKHFSTQLIRLSLGVKAEAAAVFQFMLKNEKRKIYIVNEMSSEWGGIVLSMGICSFTFKPYIATLIGLYAGTDFQTEPLGVELHAGWEVAVGYQKGRGWFTEFNQRFEKQHHRGAIIAAGNQAFTMLGLKPGIGYKMLFTFGPVSAQLGEAQLSLFQVFDVSAQTRALADGSDKKLCVSLGWMYGINFHIAAGLKISNVAGVPINWNVVGPWTYWKDLYKKKHEWSWCPMKVKI